MDPKASTVTADFYKVLWKVWFQNIQATGKRYTRGRIFSYDNVTNLFESLCISAVSAQNIPPFWDLYCCGFSPRHFLLCKKNQDALFSLLQRNDGDFLFLFRLCTGNTPNSFFFPFWKCTINLGLMHHFIQFTIPIHTTPDLHKSCR